MSHSHGPPPGEQSPLFAGRGYVYSRADLRLLERAIKGGWNLPRRVYRNAPRAIADIALKHENTRMRLAAGQVLLAMKADNLRSLR